MKTAAYTICYNEIKKLDQWLFYTKDFDYRVVLDTGSTDGTYEALKKVPGIILHQMRKKPFKFDHHRNFNLAMVPNDVDWCLSPDFDEFYSIGVLDEMEKIIKENPDVDNISTTRLDIHSRNVFQGPPNSLAFNKIHTRNNYQWKSSVYEFLCYTGQKKSVEVFSKNVFLIHDQDTTKQRDLLYLKIMKQRFEEEPEDTWNSWYLLNYYYKQREKLNYIEIAVNFLKFHSIHNDDKYISVYQDLTNILSYDNELHPNLKKIIADEITNKN